MAVFANLTIWKEQLLPHCLWPPYIILMLMYTNVLSTAQLSVALIVCAIKPSSLFCEKVGWVFCEKVGWVFCEKVGWVFCEKVGWVFCEKVGWVFCEKVGWVFCEKVGWVFCEKVGWVICEKVGWVFCEKVGWVFVLFLIMLVLHILHPSALLNIIILCNVHLNQEEDVYNNPVSLSDRINASSLSTSPTFTQKYLSSTLDDRLFQLLFDKTSPADKASLFFLILLPQASSWLSIIPSVSLGLHLEPDELVLSIGLGLHLNQMSSLLLFGGSKVWTHLMVHSMHFVLVAF